MRMIEEISSDLADARLARQHHSYTNVANLTREELAAIIANGAALDRRIDLLVAEKDKWINAPEKSA